MTLLEILLEIKRDGPHNRNVGICDAVLVIAHRELGWSQDVMEELYRTIIRWPRGTGRSTFPVPCPNGGSPSRVYLIDYENDEMWDANHPYGALRLELLDWLIEELS